MAKNDFKAFATDRNANVISQEEWEALPALLSGFTAGKASSAQVNKVIRQASFIAAALAQFVSDKTQRDVLDNGDLPGFVELLGSGFAVEYLSRKNPFGDIKSDGTVKTALENLGLTDLGIGKNIAGPNINLLSSATSSGFYAYGGNTDPDFGIDYGMVLTLLYDSVSKQRVQIYLPLANSAGATPIIRAVTGNTTIWKYKLFSEKYKPTPADVGMGSGAPAIGVPFFWPSAAMPNTVISEWSDMVFLKFNGASFSAAAYPKLAQVFPGLTLPEARGEFPRIWDDGRGVDSGRALLSTQVDAIRNITGEVGFVQYFGNTTNSGALYSGGAQNLTNLQPGGSTVAQSILFSAGKDPSVSIANENRPRNIAFNFLVRAK
ncbi:TPA: phage tail protein [Escherichia coli]|nr:phage tail protein [Escherichia coli]EHT6897139.1 phage tail protein [Escherichia coli]EHX6692211.1 phage tail protein [Escherichia coli]MBW9836182.1 phage tail protein [Escherichia coli]HAI1523158.1 phage tail protein [Escherichia coli]